MLGQLLRWSVRLFFFGLIAGVVWFVITRLLGGEDEDFDDFEDLEASFEFNETPVEIEVSAPVGADTSGASSSFDSAETSSDVDIFVSSSGNTGMSSSGHATSALEDAEESDEGSQLTGASANGASSGPRLIDIKGIGPRYESKLHSIGIKTMNDLLTGDADQIAEQVGVIGGAAEVEGWKEQARAILSEGQE